MKFHIIYKTVCSINSMIYIGQHATDNLDDGYLGSGVLLIEDIKKYGKENFKREILYYCNDSTEMNIKEKEIVDIPFVSRMDTYNIIPGGSNITKQGMLKSSKGGQAFAVKIKNNKTFRKKYCEHRREAYQKFSENKEIYNAWLLKQSILIKESFKKNGGHPWKNKKHKQVSKNKIGLANSLLQKGEKNSQYGTCWIIKNKTNKKIKKEELADYLKDGWTKGRKIK